ncbi:alpha/beta hydrolase family protein [Deinococcus malanensis]|uniref:alpha/beta hydrolase family protein n=1 Tax=Deinococcus malanensis TaxID=1706855 RepID=UPI00362B3F2D
MLLHGFTGQRVEPHRNFVLFSRLLASSGVASLRFDFRGSGESQGDFSEMTVSREVQDTVAAFEYMRRQPRLDPERVMLLGFSMGAMVASLSLAQVRPHRLALWAPALPELWLAHLRGGYMPSTITDMNGWPLGREFLMEVTRVRPLEAAAAWSGVAHVVHGDADETCPQSMACAMPRPWAVTRREFQVRAHLRQPAGCRTVASGHCPLLHGRLKACLKGTDPSVSVGTVAGPDTRTD